MKLLLTGSSGFIGSYFRSHYSDRYDIETFSFFKDDLESLDLTQIDVVVHLSALVHQMDGASKEEYERVNVVQTLELAKKAKTNAKSHFIFMSTVKVYGEETNTAYTEKSNCNPQDDYGKSKLKAELELQKLEDDNFKVSIIRTPIVYGYGVKANIKNLISLVNKVSIMPFGGIENRRSMIYVGNLCHLIDTLIQKQKSGIFLACDDKPISTTRLIQLIVKELDRNIYLIKIPFFGTLLKLLKPAIYKRLYESLEVDNNFTKEVLALKNLYTTEEGIKYTINGEKNLS